MKILGCFAFAFLIGCASSLDQTASSLSVASDYQQKIATDKDLQAKVEKLYTDMLCARLHNREYSVIPQLALKGESCLLPSKNSVQ